MEKQNLTWVDRDTFTISGKLIIYNYNAFVSIRCYKEVDNITGDTFVKIGGETTHGDTIVFVKEDYSKRLEIHNVFEKFISSRPAGGGKTVKSIKIC